MFGNMNTGGYLRLREVVMDNIRLNSCQQDRIHLGVPFARSYRLENTCPFHLRLRIYATFRFCFLSLSNDIMESAMLSSDGGPRYEDVS